MSESRIFDHPEADAHFTWLSSSMFEVIWTHKRTGIHAGNLLAEFKDVPDPQTGEPVHSIVFHTLWLHENLQARSVFRFLRKRMSPWVRKRGARLAVIPRPDGGGIKSEDIFERAGFRKDGVYGRRVADLTPGDDGMAETERMADAELSEAASGPADSR